MAVRRWAVACGLPVLVAALTVSATTPAAARPKGGTTTTSTATTRPPTGAPKTPTNLRITATTPNSMTMAWDPVTSGSNNWWYIVGGTGGAFRVDPPNTTFTHPNLYPGWTYSHYVYVVDTNGNRSGNSNTVSYTAPPDLTPPTAPTLSVVELVPTWVGLSWTRSTDNGTQVWYTLLRDGVPAGVNGSIGAQSAVIFDLQPSTTSVYQVRVADAFGNVNHSNAVTVTTPPVTDTVPPTAPTGLTGFDAGCPEAWLSWNAASDNSGGHLLYEVYVNGVRNDRGFATQFVVYVDPGLSRFAVRAVDGSGNAGPFSNEMVLQIC